MGEGYHMDLNEKEAELYELIAKIPPDMVGAEKLLKNGGFTAEEVTKATLEYLEDCGIEVNYLMLVKI